MEAFWLTKETWFKYLIDQLVIMHVKTESQYKMSLILKERDICEFFPSEEFSPDIPPSVLISNYDKESR